jgi:bifunctional DNA-binding transcriptional regulator/antitoxin component of YhaV-PrlF toxin-antitoxin module
MVTSTLTDKGQTTVPMEIRRALKVKPRQTLEWTIGPDGAATVRPRASALHLFGSLKSTMKYPGRAAEREAASRAAGIRETQYKKR